MLPGILTRKIVLPPAPIKRNRTTSPLLTGAVHGRDVGRPFNKNAS